MNTRRIMTEDGTCNVGPMDRVVCEGLDLIHKHGLSRREIFAISISVMVTCSRIAGDCEQAERVQAAVEGLTTLVFYLNDPEIIAAVREFEEQQ